jgi:hypothetical protein
VLRHTWAAREAAFRKACAELRASRGEVVFNEIVRPSIALPASLFCRAPSPALRPGGGASTRGTRLDRPELQVGVLQLHPMSDVDPYPMERSVVWVPCPVETAPRITDGAAQAEPSAGPRGAAAVVPAAVVPSVPVVAPTRFGRHPSATPAPTAAAATPAAAALSGARSAIAAATASLEDVVLTWPTTSSHGQVHLPPVSRDAPDRPEQCLTSSLSPVTIRKHAHIAAAQREAFAGAQRAAAAQRTSSASTMQAHARPLRRSLRRADQVYAPGSPSSVCDLADDCPHCAPE